MLNYIEKNHINRPYPCKAIWPPIQKGDSAYHKYFEDCEAREAYHYLNAGIWPFIGGLYVSALVKKEKYAKAKKELELLVKANEQARDEKGIKTFGFYEWLDGKTGKVEGGSSPYQAWSAGMYLYAYNALEKKKLLNF